MSHQPFLDNTAFSLLQASTSPPKLPGALLGGPIPNLETGRADLDRGAITAVLGNDSTLAQIQRSIQVASGTEQADISSILAASIGVPPVCILVTLLSGLALYYRVQSPPFKLRELCWPRCRLFRAVPLRLTLCLLVWCACCLLTPSMLELARELDLALRKTLALLSFRSCYR